MSTIGCFFFDILKFEVSGRCIVRMSTDSLTLCIGLVNLLPTGLCNWLFNNFCNGPCNGLLIALLLSGRVNSSLPEGLDSYALKFEWSISGVTNWLPLKLTVPLLLLTGELYFDIKGLSAVNSVSSASATLIRSTSMCLVVETRSSSGFRELGRFRRCSNLFKTFSMNCSVFWPLISFYHSMIAFSSKTFYSSTFSFLFKADWNYKHSRGTLMIALSILSSSCCFMASWDYLPIIVSLMSISTRRGL